MSRCHLQSLGLELKLELGGLGLRLTLMFTRAKCPTSTFHYSLLLANGVLLLLGMRVHFVMLLVLPMRVHFVVLLLMLLVRLQFVAGGVGQH